MLKPLDVVLVLFQRRVRRLVGNAELPFHHCKRSIRLPPRLARSHLLGESRSPSLAERDILSDAPVDATTLGERDPRCRADQRQWTHSARDEHPFAAFVPADSTLLRCLFAIGNVLVCVRPVMGHVANDAFEKFRYQFNVFVAERLRLLLETRHLYQKVSLLPEELLAKLSPPPVEKRILAPIVIGDEKDLFERQAADYFQGRLSITEKQLFDMHNRPTPCLVVGNVKLFCSTCGGREAFRPIWFSDVTNELVMENAKLRSGWYPPDLQNQIQREHFPTLLSDFPVSTV